jgi:hypothetical protein
MIGDQDHTIRHARLHAMLHGDSVPHRAEMQYPPQELAAQLVQAQTYQSQTE